MVRISVFYKFMLRPESEWPYLVFTKKKKVGRLPNVAVYLKRGDYRISCE